MEYGMMPRPETDGRGAGASVELPLWQSHKRVRADRIKEISQLRDTDESASREDARIRWTLDGGGYIVVTKGLIARGSPAIGDYFVRYDDGYESRSPAKAFDEGYTKVRK